LSPISSQKEEVNQRKQPPQAICVLGGSRPHCKWVRKTDSHFAAGVVVVVVVVVVLPSRPTADVVVGV